MAGSNQFYPHLLGLLGAGVPHDYGFAVRYGQMDATDVLHTTGHPEFVVNEYRETYHQFDPFGARWRKTLRKGVITSQDVADETPESRVYTSVFLRRARISDEIGLILPFPGKSCIGLFLETSQQPFSAADTERLALIYPALEGLNSAHLALQFGKMAGLVHESTGSTIPAVLLINREGQFIYKTASWREAEARDPRLSEAAPHVEAGGSEPKAISAGLTVRAVNLPDDFDLAPGGKLLVLERLPSALSSEIDVSELAIQPLTKLETRILDLITKSQSTGKIALELELSKGTVKNYKQRIYRKFAVNSERELVMRVSQR